MDFEVRQRRRERVSLRNAQRTVWKDARCAAASAGSARLLWTLGSPNTELTVERGVDCSAGYRWIVRRAMSEQRRLPPKGPRLYDLLGMPDENFERMCARLIRLEFPSAFKPANTLETAVPHGCSPAPARPMRVTSVEVV